MKSSLVSSEVTLSYRKILLMAQSLAGGLPFCSSSLKNSLKHILVVLAMLSWGCHWSMVESSVAQVSVINANLHLCNCELTYYRAKAVYRLNMQTENHFHVFCLQYIYLNLLIGNYTARGKILQMYISRLHSHGFSGSVY